MQAEQSGQSTDRQRKSKRYAPWQLVLIIIARMFDCHTQPHQTWALLLRSLFCLVEVVWSETWPFKFGRNFVSPFFWVVSTSVELKIYDHRNDDLDYWLVKQTYLDLARHSSILDVEWSSILLTNNGIHVIVLDEQMGASLGRSRYCDRKLWIVVLPIETHDVCRSKSSIGTFTDDRVREALNQAEVLSATPAEVRQMMASHSNFHKNYLGFSLMNLFFFPSFGGIDLHLGDFGG